MGNHDDIERSSQWLFDYTKLKKISQNLDENNPVIPVIVQDINTKEVLILAYANRQAVEYSLEHGIATFWSTSRNELWIKGNTSGDVLKLQEIRVNCDQNSLLYLVIPAQEGACHVHDKNKKSFRTCYYRKIIYDKKTKKIQLEPLDNCEL